MLSTCLAAMVGAVAIGVVIFGSLDAREAGIDMPSAINRLFEAPFGATSGNPSARDGGGEGPRWAVPRSDRMKPASGAPTIRQVFHEQIQVRRNGRPYNQIRPYVRIVTRLQPVSPRNFDVIPTFNPIALYGAQGADRENGLASGPRTDFKFQVIEQLIGGAITTDDGLEFEGQEVADMVAQFEAEEILARTQAQGVGSAGSSFGRGLSADATQNATVLLRKRAQQDEAGGEARQVLRVHVLKSGDRLDRVLVGLGGEPVLVKLMINVMRQVTPETQVLPGMQLQVTMVPSLKRPGVDEPARFSLLTEGGEHKVSVTRNASGDFEASDKPFTSAIARAALQENDALQSSSIYASLYNAALVMGIPPATITQKLRVHAYDTDFRRQISTGDFAEFFFDLREEAGGETAIGELLFTAMATGGEVFRYWRYRTPDNQVDYYDENGNNSKKFLLRRPVRGENVRLASGFGVRLHPILRYARPHNGIDWAAPPGTPILAAGNGVVEEAKYKGEFGNFIRIQHANGYQSSYAHMSRYAARIQEGSRVRQGEVIGYVGNTGLSAGPHLHFEIHANHRAVDPLSIQVPRERQLTGKLLAEFQKERTRIEELMRKQPVSTENK